MNRIMKTVKDSKGMTLIEVLVAVMITVLVIGGIYTLLVYSQRISVGQTYVAEMQQNARTALDMMSREILMAGYDPTNTDFMELRIAPILDASSTSIRVLADLDQDGTIDTGATDNEDITFQWSSSTKNITRQVGTGSAALIAANITSFSISYENGATTLSSSAASGATSFGVSDVSGFQIGDAIYVSDGTTLDNTFITSITGSTINIDPALTNGYTSGDTVGCVEKVTISLTAQTSEMDPQTRQYKTINLVSDVMLRNFSN